MSTEQTKEKWGRLADKAGMREYMATNWCGLENIQANTYYYRTGEKNCHWIEYFKKKYLPQGKAGDTLSLGCGSGWTEKLMKDYGIEFSSFTGVDLSEQCVAGAEKASQEANLAPEIKYVAANLNTYVLPKEQYDFIFFNHSLHHVKSLELLLSGCAEALRPNGVMLLNEFVGPTRFQWSDQQLDIINSLLQLLPEDLRFDLHSKETKAEVKRMTIEEMIFHDESEAVRSSEIDVVLKRFFNVVEEKEYGGSINNLLFSNIAGNFNLENPYHKSIVDLLIYIENTMVDNKLLPSDFKFYIVRPKRNVSVIKAYWELREKLKRIIGKN